jgi:hypothetical protein
MKKNLFLMLALFVLSAASMNAQVRIGGLDDPHKSAVLDLNAANDVQNGTLGLALPRVALATDTSSLNRTEPAPGTIVYNSASTLEGEGVYVWTKQWGSAGGPVPVTGIFITNTKVNLSVTTGYTLRLAAVLFPANATNQNLVWSISQTSNLDGTGGDVAEVDPVTGVLTGVQGGRVVVRATSVDTEDIYDEIEVDVFGPAGTVTGSGGTYNLYYYGQKTGIWMTDNSREGTPTFSGSGAPGVAQGSDAVIAMSAKTGYFYGSNARESAVNCPDGLLPPTFAQLAALSITFSVGSENYWTSSGYDTGYCGTDGTIQAYTSVYYGGVGGAFAYGPTGSSALSVGTDGSRACPMRCVKN